MKVSLKKLSVLGLLSVSLLSATSSFANVTLTNQTSLSLGTSISGLPGQSISPNSSRSANYTLLSMGCFFGGSTTNCPILFTDNATGSPVATVYINVDTLTLTQPPRFHGTYANDYEATGWQASPISTICIVKKDNAVSVVS